MVLGYGLLLPSLLALAQATGSFALDSIVARPGQFAPLPLLLRVGALACWGLALVPLLALGPFQSATMPAVGTTVRAVGHILLATLPILPLLGDRWWLAPLPPLALGLLLVVIDRTVWGRALLWELLLRGATWLLWTLLAWAALAALLARAG